MTLSDNLTAHLKSVGGRIGLVSQQASPTADRIHSFLSALFSPEHGWFGLAAPGERTETEIHPIWKLPVHSLYGATRKPTPEMLDGLDRLVIDLSDIGVRCYTYLATLKLVLEAAAENGIAVTVLDHPIPLGGIVDGPMRGDKWESFVAPLNVPMCHGMTPGESAEYIRREETLDLDLTVIGLRDWSHGSKSPWRNFIPPSPGIKSWDSAVMYPVTVFTEAYPALDCNRSGSLAFRVFGAEWLDAEKLIADLSDAMRGYGIDLRGYRYASGDAKALNGVMMSLGENEFRPIRAGLVILKYLLKKYSEEMRVGARDEWFSKLYGVDNVDSNELSDASMDAAIAQWNDRRVNLYESIK